MIQRLLPSILLLAWGCAPSVTDVTGPSGSSPSFAGGATGHGDVPWGRLATSQQVWMICLQYFCLSYGWYFYITWLPTYLREGRHLEIVSTAMFGIIPLFFGGLGNPASVLLASRLVRANGDVARTRRIIAYLGFTGASAFLILSTLVNDPMWAVLAIGMASFSNDLVMPGSWAAAMDVGGKMLAFVNLLSVDRDEITGDLMRRRANAPNGIMDYLLFELLQHAKARGYGKVSLGLAPMTGFQKGERATAEERVIHALLQKLDFLFSFRGLHRYKAKFATCWEPRYLIYRNMLQLPRTALALHRLSETKGETDAGLPREERQAYKAYNGR
jgi:hypothetical protein